MRKTLFFLYFTWIGSSFAIEPLDSPWIDPVLEPVITIKTGYQSFDQLQSGASHLCYPSQDFFLATDLFFALSADLSFDVGARFTRTHAHDFAIDEVFQKARLVIWDDARGDPFALAFGLDLREPISWGLKDPSFIHHALFEAEFQFLIGKEWIFEADSTAHLYGLGAFGLGIQGLPWMRGFIASDIMICFNQRLEAKLLAEMGFGKDHLHPHHFHGYGNVAYRIIDAKIGYTYMGEWADISIEYLHSLYRRNAPENVQQVMLSISYPFNF